MKACISQYQFGPSFTVIQDLNKGGLHEIFTVKEPSSEIYFLKLFKRGTPFKTLTNELEISLYLFQNAPGNPHFIEYISSASDRKSKRTYLVYQYFEKGTLEEKLILPKSFEEPLAIIVFWQTAKKIQVLHSMGISHGNITLDKIFIDGNYDIKIGGFGSAQFIKDFPGEEKSLIENDIFQLGVLFLQLITGKCDMKILEKRLLKIIKKGDKESFWKMIEKQTNQKIQKNIKDLITIMLTIKSHSQENWTLDEILNNDFLFQGVESELSKNFMKERFKQIEKEEDNFNFNFY